MSIQSWLPWVAQLLANPTDGKACVIWPGVPDRSGYGKIKVDGKQWGAHVYVLTMAVGPKPPDKDEAAHKCGVKRCVELEHLYWATRAENCADKKKHGTNNEGTRHGRSKLDDDSVRAIRHLASVGVTQVTLAKQFGVSQTTISLVVRKKIWSHL